MNWPKVVIGIPMERNCHVKALNGIVSVAMNAAVKNWEFMDFAYGRSDNQRNNMVEHFLDSPRFDYLAMLDSDHRHPALTVEWFARIVMKKPEIKFISGLNFRRSEPWEPVAYRQWPGGKYAPLAQWGKGIVEADAVGGAAFMVAREIYEAVEPPWFFRTYTLEEGKIIYTSEDINFCKKVKEKGYKIYLHTGITAPHLYLDEVGDVERFKKWLKTQGAATDELTAQEINQGRIENGRSKNAEPDTIRIREHGGNQGQRNPALAWLGAHR